MTRRKKRSSSPTKVALAFLDHLDARRFGAAERCLAAACIYQPVALARIVGAAAIIQSYRDGSPLGTRAHDELHYTSRVEQGDAETVSIELTDYLRYGTRSHTFVSRQLFTVRDGLIQRIVATETPTARRALKAFFSFCEVGDS